ncbi:MULTISPECIES: biopolymer transporter ExbD [unclassified Mucilaginibacter]|uniref:ExbD/TolR family protein n=1 Tax=unclassified Mucilaginibacter TaxID=2617802 RepID=UPI002AC8D416|nr:MULTISPECIES: biopolymer transporter ExbD [unclassified Mucilaginibacter]MEB0263968.1 biopolymer transporter ExbD [Mucilaginibacter sp. 10I4]MEB0279830.1 biopolymer transporter ExbD [Mucilaginibacter sp. 10B2]MEB0303244.1 biopolymer transporter ExbD [Mucilaginibacter sp. 5C4]WPX24198.1 biopolymer transporter ExbD [Mucilaginibacter sp. 5C4]
MAELDTSGGGKKGGKVRSKKASTRVDLTAMVDLAFLLITFFMLTTTLSKPKAMDVTMPNKDEKTKEQLPVAASRSMTILLGANNKLEWFIGEPGKSQPTTEGYGKDGIRKTLIEKGKEVQASFGNYMVVLIKPSDKSNYKNLVDVLDEMKITNVQSYAIVDILPSEVELLKRDGNY